MGVKSPGMCVSAEQTLMYKYEKNKDHKAFEYPGMLDDSGGAGVSIVML
jgi:hypothetical protein